MSFSKRILGGLLALIVLMSGISYCLADTIMPFADEVFDATKVELSSSGRVKLYCATYGNKASIKVTACWLEKEVGGKWAFDCSLTPPAEESINTDAYAATLIAYLQSEKESIALPQRSMQMVMKSLATRQGYRSKYKKL